MTSGKTTSKVTLLPVRALVQAWADLTRKQTGAGRRTGSRLKVFLDCDACFKDGIRSEIDFVEYVRDRRTADVCVSVTAVRSNGKARHCIVTFIGVGRFAHIEASARLRLTQHRQTSTRRQDPAESDRERKSTRQRRQGALALELSAQPHSNSLLTFPGSSVTLLPPSARARIITRHAR